MRLARARTQHRHGHAHHTSGSVAGTALQCGVCHVPLLHLHNQRRDNNKKKDSLTMCMQNTTNFYNITSALALCFLFLLVLCDRAAPAAVVVQECRFALLFHKATCRMGGQSLRRSATRKHASVRVLKAVVSIGGVSAAPLHVRLPYVLGRPYFIALLARSTCNPPLRPLVHQPLDRSPKWSSQG